MFAGAHCSVEGLKPEMLAMNNIVII